MTTKCTNKYFSVKKKEILKVGFPFYIWIIFLLLSFCLMFSCCSSGEQMSFKYRSTARKIDKMFTAIHNNCNFNGCVQVCYNDLIIFNKSFIVKLQIAHLLFVNMCPTFIMSISLSVYDEKSK